MGVRDYIQMVRVEESKRLLTSARTIKGIAELVGYQDSATLTRAFKRLEGTTPAQFREGRGSADRLN